MKMKIESVSQLYEILPENEKVIVDILRQIVIENIPSNCREKISYNVPYFYCKRGICIIWPSSIPNGGIKEGVLLGFSHGNRLRDEEKYLIRGNNKQVFYRIYKSPDEIEVEPIINLLREAVTIASK